MIEAMYYSGKENNLVICNLCPHECIISNGNTGICHVRKNIDGTLYADSYGKITSIAIDPIEKKPLYHFHPNSKILSVGSFGCNFRCSFCQNYEISMKACDYQFVSPEALVEKALEMKDQNNIGIAYTYNEPLIAYEYVLDTAKLAQKMGLKNVLVTNGFISIEPLNNLLPYIDAMNIDLKSFSDNFYKSIGGTKNNVMETIEIAAKRCHVELTTLIIPEENDSENEMDALASWVKSISDEIPLHINRFFPRYQMLHKEQTPLETIIKLSDIAKKYLKYVYTGNIY